MANTTHASLAAEAAAYLAKSASADEGFSGSEKEIGRQADRLLEWARERGVFLTDSHTAGLDKEEYETTEHEVFYRESDNRAVKCTYPGSFGNAQGLSGKSRRATPLFYLRRLELMNQEFPTGIRLEGVMLGTPRYGGEEKKPSIVTSQHWIDAADEKSPYPSDEEVESLMIYLEFIRVEDSCYRWFRKSDGVIICDAKPANFIKSHDGVFPIDLIISKLDSPATIR